jgi:hypothetical protein
VIHHAALIGSVEYSETAEMPLRRDLKALGADVRFVRYRGRSVPVSVDVVVSQSRVSVSPVRIVTVATTGGVSSGAVSKVRNHGQEPANASF